MQHDLQRAAAGAGAHRQPRRTARAHDEPPAARIGLGVVGQLQLRQALARPQAQRLRRAHLRVRRPDERVVDGQQRRAVGGDGALQLHLLGEAHLQHRVRPVAARIDLVDDLRLHGRRRRRPQRGAQRDAKRHAQRRTLHGRSHATRGLPPRCDVDVHVQSHLL
ncbi:MAG: hypothetical protein IPM15_08140 [Betaproteobacteria bacterium]|nr:hypothetical protein [Betaproteobacteria bacterium]